MKCGLIGKDVSKSFSKEIHAIPGKYEYDLISLPSESLEGFISSRDFDGLNVTIPYKKEVIKYCDELSYLAKEIGAVNTLYFKDGKLIGDNTDYSGFIYMINRAKIELEHKNVLIFGDGGASAMVQYACYKKKAKKVFVDHRGDLSLITGKNKREKVERDIKGEIDIIINTTPLGRKPFFNESPADIKEFPNLEAVFDLNYNPLKTKLILDAEALNIKAENGLSMLVMQALAAGALWSDDIRPSAKACEGIIKIIEKRVKNIVLIGMGGSGKSSVARELSKMCHRPLADVDKLIINRMGMSIPQIFEKYGEERFREIETEEIKDIACENGYVVATGGGVIANEENMKLLKQNGYFILLNRRPENLARFGRPVYKDDETVMRLYLEREPEYEKYADIVLDSEGDLRQVAKQIIKMI